MQWKLEKRNIFDLKPHPKNPRRLTKDQEAHIAKSLEKFGLVEKPIITADNQIIGGHQRLKVLKKQGVKEIECWVAVQPMTQHDVDELNIRLNKNTGEFDFDILANEWEIADLVEWGFSLEEFDIDASAADDGADDDETLEPAKDEDAVTKLGDCYELNNHRLVCGDSTSAETVERVLGQARPILMVTDLPYGVEYDPSWRSAADKGCRAAGKVQNDGIVDWSAAWKLFPGDAAYVWHAGRFASAVQQSLEFCDFEVLSQIIWEKQHFALSRGDYHWKHEPCWYVVRKGRPHNWQGARDQATLWEIANLNAFGGTHEEGEERTAHSTQKPMECMARPIRNNTTEGQEVYDPFLGSGTTLLAAEKLNRVCYGIELSPAYCDIIVDRWRNYMDKSGKEYCVKRNGEVIDG